MIRRVAIGAAATALLLPAAAQANGDPASDYLLVQKVFLPFNSKVDSDVATRLEKLLDAAAKAKFPIRVAVIGTPTDLGTAFSLFNKPQRYAEFLGLELSFLYRDRLLVVMPSGFGYAVNGDPDPKVSRVVSRSRRPARTQRRRSKRESSQCNGSRRRRAASSSCPVIPPLAIASRSPRWRLRGSPSWPLSCSTGAGGRLRKPRSTQARPVRFARVHLSELRPGESVGGAVLQRVRYAARSSRPRPRGGTESRDRAVRRPRRVHSSRRAARPGGRSRDSAPVFRAGPQRDRGVRRNRREVHR